MKKTVLLSLLLASATSVSMAQVAINYDVSTYQNRRPYQEDRFAYASIDFSKGYNPFVAGRNYYRGQFFGIYDGHGGDKVSSYLQNNLHKQLHGRTSLETAFCLAFVAAEKYALENYDDGSTAVTAFINKENRLCLAWTGDSRAVLENNGVVGFATQDHKPERVDERARIKEVGGDIFFHGVWRVNGLAVSRSIGDRQLKNMGQGHIIAVPETEEIWLKESNHFMILASDGLWDVISSEDAVSMVQQELSKTSALKGVAQILQNEAIKRGSDDNITVCVVQFDWSK
jgi:protein phosphatase 1L